MWQKNVAKTIFHKKQKKINCKDKLIRVSSAITSLNEKERRESLFVQNETVSCHFKTRYSGRPIEIEADKGYCV